MVDSSLEVEHRSVSLQLPANSTLMEEFTDMLLLRSDNDRQRLFDSIMEDITDAALTGEDFISFVRAALAKHRHGLEEEDGQSESDYSDDPDINYLGVLKAAFLILGRGDSTRDKETGVPFGTLMKHFYKEDQDACRKFIKVRYIFIGRGAIVTKAQQKLFSG